MLPSFRFCHKVNGSPHTLIHTSCMTAPLDCIKSQVTSDSLPVHSKGVSFITSNAAGLSVWMWMKHHFRSCSCNIQGCLLTINSSIYISVFSFPPYSCSLRAAVTTVTPAFFLVYPLYQIFREHCVYIRACFSHFAGLMACGEEHKNLLPMMSSFWGPSRIRF